MSDQQSSSPPPKKPGSLRDRIAAFEKSAAAPASTGQPTSAPRPKPAGFASWKPKVPSPPSSPSSKSIDGSSSRATTGTMSASDAKESITKGGSLKDRMAALQGKGAFGAPAPPLAPKPAVEKPRWKPPPTVVPINDDHDGAGDEPLTAPIAATVDRSKSSPVSARSRASLDLPNPLAEGEETSTTTTSGGDVEGTTDLIEEERQRRAAIAARMARLAGGARLGMGPPLLAKKPTRKPTSEDIPKQEDHEEIPRRQSLSLEERGKIIEGTASSPTNAEEGATVASPPSITDSPQIQPQSDIELFPDRLPVRENSENVSLHSVDSAESNASRSPPSMPVPNVPRRPPRRKPLKPPPEVPEEQVEDAPHITSTVDVPEHKTIETTEEKVTPEHEDHKEIENHHVNDSDVKHEPAEELPSNAGESKEQESTCGVQYPLEASDEPKHRNEHVGFDSPDRLEDGGTIREGQSEDGESHEDEIIESADVSGSHDNDVEPQPSHGADVTDVTGTEEEEEDAAEEEVRRKHIAERLAKMGGINPLASLPRSSEETSHASPPSVALPASPSRLDIPSRKGSLPASHQVAEPHPQPVVESKVEEEGEGEHSDEIEDDNSDIEEEPSDEIRVQHQQQAHTASVNQLSDPVPRSLVPGSVRPQVQIQQYGRADTEKEQGAHPATRQLPPPSRLPGAPVTHEEAPPSPARPTQPPRRIVPQAPEEQEQEPEEEEEEEEEEEARTDDDEFVPSHLFVRPVQPRGTVSQRSVRDEDGDEDGSDNDAAALPVLQRRSQEEPLERPLLPPPPPVVPLSHHHHTRLTAFPSDVSEPDSDHDGQALPVRPRHTAISPAPQTSAQVPTGIPRRSIPPVPTNEESFSPYGMPSVAVSEPEPREILDEEEGDPIDPAFHSPSRRASAGNVRSSTHDDTSGLSVPTTPILSVDIEKREEGQEQQEQDQMKRRTIAERMAKLGGLKFGAAPIPASISRLPPRVPQGEELDEEGGTHHYPEHRPQADAEDVEQPVEISEEEEERARKERIAAKLAGMGGMRIGMMPTGMGPRGAYVSRDENMPPPSPIRAVPPVQPPPVPRTQIQDTDSERASDDGVKVEAEESEMEEIHYEDAVEELEEKPSPSPPPIPSRMYRRESTEKATSPPPPRVPYHRESTDKATSPPSSLIPGVRPPVPAAFSARRSSVQTSISTGSLDFGLSPSQTTSSHGYPQSEYVIVDEPHSLEEPTPPNRRTSQVPLFRPPPNQTGMPQTSDPSISSQWELPSIPTAALDFGSGADLSLSSWTDAGESTSPAQSPSLPSKQPAVLSTKHKAVLPSELQLSADELMKMWGRVGVQVCEVATSLFEHSKKTLIGDGTYAGFINAVLAGVPNAASISIASGVYGYLIYTQNGPLVQKRVSDIMPGDIVEIHEGKLKGHKGLQMYAQNVGGSGEALLGVVGEFEAKKSKIRVFHANQHVGQQTVESVSYRLEDLKSGTVKVFRVLEG